MNQLFKPGNRRNLMLGLLLLASSLLAAKSSSDKLPRWLQGTRVESWLSQFSTGNQNVHDISVGFIVSVLVYFLVAWLPEHNKRRRIRRNLERRYDSFKEECIRIFLSAMSGGYDPAMIDGLKDWEQFMEYFSAPFRERQSRWHAVANGLDAEHIRSLIVEFEILIDELRFTLIAIDVEDQETFDFLKHLVTALYRARNCVPEYDGVKSLLGMMWSVFAGWSFTEGYAKRDVIADMIRAM